MRISIMQWNEKYIIEMEAGQYKQTYKISQDSVSGLEEVKALCSQDLMDNTMARFSNMHNDFSTAFKSLK
jgi:hypothetical protein